ncbi:MAG: class I SAM-dependent methyltransferase [Steroidobacteraceae bacterium]
MFRNALLAACCTAALLGSIRAEALGKMPAYIAGAVADPARPAEDKQDDQNRKPAETVQFAGIKPGDKVVELVPGRGYFTRIISKVVGPKGHVYALSPPRRPNAAPDSPDPVSWTTAIAADPAYSNVSVQAGSIAKIAVPEPADVVFTSRNYHDVHNVPNIDLAAFNKSVFEALKPGGMYIVLDHAAAKGSGARDTSTLHRIDPEAVKAEALAAGFVLAGQSNVLANPQDAHTAPVFDSSVKGKTDQFILKFRKPKK